jgi:cellulose synthase/poly-beta-1,6-N-acetylglucosamine synthase-like glycosyltransferase
VKTPPAISLIIAVYNKPQELRFVLAGCQRQSFRDFEVIIADDGSGPAVRDVVNETIRTCSFPVVHLWHEDRGWRKNTIMNNGIRNARGEYLVFIDGDCIPTRHFLHDHWNQREPGKALLGRRVETSQRWSAALTLEQIRNGNFERLGWKEILDGLKGDSLRVEDGIRIRSAFLRRLLLRNVSGMLGSNFSATKRDLEAINGFDELYTGPGCGEDSDIQFRLGLIGVTGKSLRNLAIQYHIFHPRTKTSDACWERFQEVKASREPRCRHGLILLT